MKKLHRFLVSTLPKESTYTITDPKLVHQIVHVLRYKKGEELIIFAQHSDDVIVKIESLSKRSVVVLTQTTVPARPKPDRYVIAAVSIVKRDLFELITEKLTELGVREIVPIVSGRTIKQSIKQDRLELIAREAIEQSGQSILPIIHPPTKLGDALERFDMQTIVFDPHYTASKKEYKGAAIYYIGPEGGWSPDDMALFETRGAQYHKLCDTVLRTETAAIVGGYELLR